MAQTESRVKKTLLNARVNLIFYFLTLLLSFFSRKIFLDCLGDDFIGLTGTLQNLLGFLNLAELGVGTAIGYLLYKPLFDRDEEKITEIISVMGYLYRWIGFIILGGGLVLACFLPLIFPDRDTHLTLGIIYFVYFAFLGSSLIGYFINYRQNLLGADQRNYVVTGYFQGAGIVKVLIQIAIAYYTRNLYLWVAIEFIFGILFAFILNWKINQTYPWLKANAKLGHKIFKKYPEVMIKTRQSFVHKIGLFFQYQSMPFLIYAFTSLTLVAFYQNYTMVTSRITLFFTNLFSGMGASVGNLIAEGNKEKIMNVFWELNDLRFFIGGLVCVPAYLLMDSFIKIWLGAEYILPQSTLILIIIPLFQNIARTVLDEFNYGYGLFWDVWAPIMECLILAGSSIGFGYFWGLNGVLTGPVTSLFLIMLIWKPILLFHWGFKSSPVKYWIVYLRNLIWIFVPGYLAYYVGTFFEVDLIDNFFSWLGYAVAITAVYAVVSYLSFLCFSDGMKLLNHRITEIIKSKLTNYLPSL